MQLTITISVLFSTSSVNPDLAPTRIWILPGFFVIIQNDTTEAALRGTYETYQGLC